MSQQQEIRLLTDSFYEIQSLRIQIGNRIGMLVQDYEVEEAEAASLHEMISGRLVSTEKEIEKRVRKFIKGLPVFQLWIGPHVKGVSELLGGSLIAGIGDIDRFDNVAKLWTYCGVGLNANGEVQKRRAGEKINYSPFLKTTCWKIGESFNKVADRGYYGEMLRTYKTRETDKLKRAGIQIIESLKVDNLKELQLKESGKWPAHLPEGCRTVEAKKLLRTVDLGATMSLGHVHSRAKRKAVKLFLSHLWLVWREIEGLPTRNPYVIEHFPDHQYYPPPGWPPPGFEPAEIVKPNNVM